MPGWRLEPLERRRLLAAGALDASFGVGGAVSIARAEDESISSVVELPDGKLLAGLSVDSHVELMRLNGDGSLDTTFGAGGKLLTSFISDGRRIAVNESDGRIAVGGSKLRIAIFDVGGTFQREIAAAPLFNISEDTVTDLRFGFTPDGKLIVACTGQTTGENPVGELGVVRLKSDGTLDTTFGEGGKASVEGFSLQRLLVNADGTALVFGVKEIAFFDPDVGGFETFVTQNLYFFDTAGAMTTNFWGGGNDEVVTDVTDMAQGSDGSVAVLKDKIGPNENVYPHVVRLVATGQPIGEETLVTLDGSFRDVGTGVEPSGRVPVVGFDSSKLWMIHRFNSAGGRDRSYGDEGTVVLDLPAHEDDPGDAVVLADGDVLIAANRERGDGRRDIVFMRVDGGMGFTFSARVNVKGELIVNGTGNSDSISITRRRSDDRVVIRSGDDVKSFAYDRMNFIVVTGEDGDDRITIGQGLAAAVVDGGQGNDTIVGSEFGDTLVGGLHDDLLIGESGNDQLFGDDGRDKLSGGEGNDYLLGGAGRDDLYGDIGDDTLSGAGGNDRLFGFAGRDRVLGGAGTLDLAEDDLLDRFATIERFLGSDVPVDLDALQGRGSAMIFSQAPLPRSFRRFTDAAVRMNDGRVVVAAKNDFNKLELARFNADGLPDATFGDGGAITSSEDLAGVLHPSPIAVASDGRIAVVMASFVTTRVVVFTAAGAVESSFLVPAERSFANDTAIAKIAFTTDNKLILAGAVPNNAPDSRLVAVRRYTTEGSLDASFGDGGEAKLTFPDDVVELDVGADGKITLATNYSHYEDVEFQNFVSGHRVYRLTAGGQLDSTFASEGELAIDPVTPDATASIVDMSIAPGGTITLLTSEFLQEELRYLRRFSITGQPLGNVTLTGELAFPRSITTNSAGETFIFGRSTASSPLTNSFVWRLHADGSIDRSWRHDGRAPLPLSETRAMLLEPDGNLLIAGASAGHKSIALVRLRTEGG